VAGIAAAVLLFVTDIIVLGVILKSSYMGHYTFARPVMPVWPGIVRPVATGLLFAWIYTCGLQSGSPGWAQGMRFGFWVGLFFWVGYAFLDYAILPIPFFYVVAWIVAGTIQAVLAGLVVGSIYPLPGSEGPEGE